MLDALEWEIMMDKYMRIMDILHEIEEGIWISVATNSMLWIFAPLELLFTNQDEFWFDAYTLISMMVIVFAVISIISIAAFAFLKKINVKIYRLGVVLYFSAFICLYIQGNWLKKGLPVLDGDPGTGDGRRAK